MLSDFGIDCVAELSEDGSAKAQYVRGLGLICELLSGRYYLTNAHGDVTALTDATGNVVKKYSYDAFGNEENPDAGDRNPFRYCGEYFDIETGQIYLRARIYTPTNGRFTQEDTHWNPGNMIYGDENTGNEITERIKWQHIIQKHIEDIYTSSQLTSDEKIIEATRWRLGQLTAEEKQLVEYEVNGIPLFEAIMQSSNLYAYSMNNPIKYNDPSGKSATLVLGGITITAGQAALAGVTLALLWDWATGAYFTKAFVQGVQQLGMGIVAALQYAKASRKISSKIKNNSGNIDLSKFNNPNGPMGPKGGRGILGPLGYYIVKDIDNHSGSMWKLFDKAGKLIASIKADGTIVKIY